MDAENVEQNEQAPAVEEKPRDWVGEAYEAFIKNAADIDPTDPVEAVGAYFEKNATDELKARCKGEGKDAKGCWRFVEAVARKALHGHDGHIDPAVVYAIAMHWFEDVPVDWEKRPTPTVQRQAAPTPQDGATAKKRHSPRASSKVERAKKAAGAVKPKKPKKQQGFFFDVLMQPDAQKPCGASSPQESPVAPAEETAMEPSSEAGISTTESEVQG